MRSAKYSFKGSVFSKCVGLGLGLAMAWAVAFPNAFGASATWNGTVDALWTNAANWSASPAPDVNDTATFNNAGNGRTNIDLSTGVTVSNIIFDTSSAAPYTIGTGAAGSQTLTLPSNAVITVNSTVTQPQVINAALSLGTNAAAGSYNIVNNSTQPLTVLGPISGASGGTAGAKTLYISGSGQTIISNTANGGGGALSVRPSGSGTVTLAGNSTMTGPIVVSNGTFNLTGVYNANASGGNLAVGGSNTVLPIAVCNVYGTFSNINGGASVYIGSGQQDLINSRGILNQYGGVICVGQNLMLGRNAVNTAQAYGFYNLKGGRFQHLGTNRIRIGQADGGPNTVYLMYLTGTGSMTINSVGIGLNDTANNAHDGSGGNPAVLYVSSGFITNASGGICIGIGGKGNLTTNIVTVADSGSIVCIGTVGLGASASGSTAGNNAGRVAYLNLINGGFLQTSRVYLDSSQSPIGYVNFSGGTLKAQGGTTTYMAGLTRATVYSGGLTFDDNGQAVTIGQSLMAPEGTGIVSIAVSGATGYIGAPYVRISGGGATVPATAVALIDDAGNVTNIVVTSPGEGYTSTPTITLVAPFGTPGTVTPTMGALGSGGLTKTGSGTLTLAGNNTYTGLTTVASGTLRMSNSTVRSSVSVGSGLGFGASGVNFIGGSLALGSGATLNLSNLVAATLTVSNGVTLNNNTLNFSLGGVSATNNLKVVGGLSVSGLNTVNLNAAGGFGTPGNYQLITGAGLANTNNFVLGATPSGPYSFALAVSGGDLVVQVTSSLPPSAFWQGDVSASWNNAANWASDAAGTNDIAVPPGAATTVEFATGNAQNFSTTLDADFTINTLTFSTPSNVTISGANVLTNINGITIGSGAGANTISAGNLVLGFDQTWANNGSNTFTVSSPIGGGAVALTIAGSGKTVLSGTSTYTGGTTVNGGTLALGHPTDTLANSGALTISNATVDIGGNSDTVGLVTMTSGTITGTTGVLSGSFYTVQQGTISAVLGGTGTLTKIGDGTTVTLTRTNTYTGGTFVRGGTLVVDTSGVVSNTNFSSIGRQESDIGTLTLQGNAAYLIAGDFNVGDIGASKGYLNIADNARVQANNMFVSSANGGASTTYGEVNQTGGSVFTTATGDNSLLLGGRASGTGNNGSATYNLNAGNVTVGGTMFIGGYGSGTFNVNGGTLVVSNYLSIARFQSTAATQPASKGTLTVSSGSVTANVNNTTFTLVGEEGTGTLVIASSGVMYVNGNNGLVVGHFNSGAGNSGAGVGTVNLNGGTLITTNVNKNLGGTNGVGVFNFNGGTLRAKGPHPTFMTGLNAANVLSGGAVIDDSGFNITIGQALLNGGGAGGLTKLGAGTLTLTGSNTYQGATVVSAGKLVVPAYQTSTGAVTVADGAALRITASGSSQWSPASLTLGSSAPATIEFAAISSTNVAPLNVGTYTRNAVDPLRVVGGNFVNSNAYPLIQYGTITGSGTNVFTAPGGMVASLINSTQVSTLYLFVENFGIQLWKGNVSTNWDIEITTNWTVNSIPVVYGDGGPTMFDDTATTTTVRIVSEVAPSAVIISNSAKTYTFSGAAISGSGTLTKDGPGLVIMGNTNTYSGDTTISNGTFRLAGDNVIPGGAAKGSVILLGTLDLGGRSNLVNGLSGTGTVDSTVAGTPVLTVGGDGSSSVFSGVVQNTVGALRLVKTGAGAFTLVNSNGHSGGTTLLAGQLNINHNGALGAAGGTFTINAGTIDVTTSNDITVANDNPQNWFGDFTYAGSITNLNLGNGSVTKTGNVQVTVSANNLTVGGVISGSGSLNKAGAGTLTLLGLNTFPGNMNIAQGTLVVSTVGDTFSPGGVGAGLAITFGSTAGNGTLRYIGTGEETFKQIAITSSGSGAIDMSGSGLLKFSSDWTITGAGAHTFQLIGSGPGTGEIAGVVSDFISGTTTNATAITKDGPGVWVLSADSSNTGSLSIRDGKLVVDNIGNSNAPSRIGMHSTINLGGGSTTGTLVYVGSGETSDKIIRIAAGLGTGGATIDQSGTGLLKFVSDLTAAGAPQPHLLRLTGSSSGTGELAGGIPDESLPNNRTSLLKDGTGTWTLSGTNNTYTGSTTITNGTLAIAGNGQITNSPTITVVSPGVLDVSVHNGGGITIVSNQTLAGNGTVVGALTLADGAILSPGGSPGVLTITGSLGLNNATILNYELGTNSDRTVVSGTLTLDGVINVTDAGGLSNGTYVIFNYGSLVNNGLSVGTMPGSATATVSNDAPNNRILLVVGNVTAGDPYTTWASNYGLTGGNALGTADPDGDGMNNTNEFLAGFNPTNSAAYLRIINVAKSGNDINVTYLGANGDVNGSPGPKTNVLEFTTGTANGSYTNNFVSTGQTNILTGGTGLGVVTNMVDSGGATNVPSRYYRVRVLTP